MQALADLAATATARGVHVQLDIDASADDLPEEDQHLCHRIAQEALRNIATHAAPCTATVTLGREQDETVLTVADDGPGFDSDEVRARRTEGHLGTRVLVDLAEQAGAELELATAPGRGTAWRLTIPGHRIRVDG